MAEPSIDPGFLALPYQHLAQVALERARDFGVTHADFRFERIRHQHMSIRDGHLQGVEDGEDLGFAVRVIHRGAWGFASGVALTTDAVVKVAEQAGAVAGRNAHGAVLARRLRGRGNSGERERACQQSSHRTHPVTPHCVLAEASA